MYRIASVSFLADSCLYYEQSYSPNEFIVVLGNIFYASSTEKPWYTHPYMKTPHKFLITIPLLALMLVPSATQALSCMPQSDMIEYYVSDDSYMIVTATPMAEKEYRIEESTDFPGQYGGYSSQLLSVTEAHKGSAPDSMWAYYEVNHTWGYLCVGNPPDLNTENMYVIRSTGQFFELPMVIAVFPADSEVAESVLEALEEVEAEGATYEVSNTDWVNRMIDDLKRMAEVVKIKLAELMYWQTAK